MGSATPRWLDAAEDSPEHQDWCRRTLAAYFELSGGRPCFSGARFESLGTNDPWRITADDLVAVTLLSVKVPQHAAIRVLETDAEDISTLLRKIGPDRDLSEQPAPEIGRSSPGWRLWDLLRGRGRRGPSRSRADTVQIGETTTSKLLARKRPRLFPIYDSVVGKQLGLSNSLEHWTVVQEILQRPGRVDVLDKARAAANLPAEISVLRVFDILMWMSVRDGHQPPLS